MQPPGARPVVTHAKMPGKMAESQADSESASELTQLSCPDPPRSSQGDTPAQSSGEAAANVLPPTVPTTDPSEAPPRRPSNSDSEQGDVHGLSVHSDPSIVERPYSNASASVCSELDHFDADAHPPLNHAGMGFHDSTRDFSGAGSLQSGFARKDSKMSTYSASSDSGRKSSVSLMVRGRTFSGGTSEPVRNARRTSFMSGVNTTVNTGSHRAKKRRSINPSMTYSSVHGWEFQAWKLVVTLLVHLAPLPACIIKLVHHVGAERNMHDGLLRKSMLSFAVESVMWCLLLGALSVSIRNDDHAVPWDDVLLPFGYLAALSFMQGMMVSSVPVETWHGTLEEESTTNELMALIAPLNEPLTAREATRMFKDKSFVTVTRHDVDLALGKREWLVDELSLADVGAQLEDPIMNRASGSMRGSFRASFGERLYAEFFDTRFGGSDPRKREGVWAIDFDADPVTQNNNLRTLAYMIWGMTAGNKRHATYKLVTNVVALAHSILPAVLHLAVFKCSDRAFQATDISVLAIVCVAMFFYSRMLFRMIHRSMFTFLRFRHAMVYLLSILDAEAAAKFRLPFIDLTDVEFYPLNLFAWNELRHVMLQLLLHKRTLRASIVIGVATAFLIVLCVMGIFLLTVSGGRTCGAMWIVVILDTVVLGWYLLMVLVHGGAINDYQKLHYQKLSSLKFIIEQHQWSTGFDAEDEPQPVPPQPSGWSRSNPMLRTASMDSSGMASGKVASPDILAWIDSRKAVSLLDALRPHLIDRDQPVRLMGMEVNTTLIIQLFAFVFVCTISQIVEVLSGRLIF